jgi:hypothetical protein
LTRAGIRRKLESSFDEGSLSMSKRLFAFALLSSALTFPQNSYADTIDDFVITGNGDIITFSLPASPPGNHSTCPTNIIHACEPGSRTEFIVNTLVTIDGVSSQNTIIHFLTTNRYIGGLAIYPAGIISGMIYGGPQLFEPDAANPTFVPGTYTLHPFFGLGLDPATLTITPEAATTPTPEPSSVVLLITGTLGIVCLAGLERYRTFRPRAVSSGCAVRLN